MGDGARGLSLFALSCYSGYIGLFSAREKDFFSRQQTTNRYPATTTLAVPYSKKSIGKKTSIIIMYSSRLFIFLQILFAVYFALELPRVASFVAENHSRRQPIARWVASKDTDASTKGFFWDFQGHSCYAEVAEPTTIDPKKPVALLIHGFACSTVYWRETKAYLNDAGYTVHLVDLLGQGKSSKPGRNDTVHYSIDLWAKMVDEYAHRHMDLDDSGVVLVGNSLGSVVALSAATGDCYSNDQDSDNQPYLASRVKGLCFFNCGIGMNVQNAVKVIESKWLKSIVAALFAVLNFLIFNNKPLLTYVIDNQVSKETLRNALLNLYSFAEDPESKVDDELVNSFLDPVVNDSTEKVVDVLSQIYTNDAGTPPMEMHTKYLSSKETQLPIHLIWGDQDPIAPITGDTGRFYSKLATVPGSGVTLDLIQDAGHIPFDERPECNVGFIKWLEENF